MMKREICVYMLIVLAAILSACGPSEAELSATGTQVAADIFATQTALAPTATQTYTPSPTLTPSPTPTVTPSPTNTPTITPTAMPHLMAAALTLDDLPAGFSELPEEAMADMQEGLSKEQIAFGFSDETNSQLIMGILMPFERRQEQLAFDQMMPQFLDMLASPIDRDAIPEPLTGLDDIGESKEGSTLLADNEEPPMRWDLLVFRRGEVAVILYIVYPDEDEAIMPYQDIARLLDDRIEELQSQDW